MSIPGGPAASFPAELKRTLAPVYAQLGLPYRRPRLARVKGTLLALALTTFLCLFPLLLLAWIIDGLFPGAHSLS